MNSKKVQSSLLALLLSVAVSAQAQDGVPLAQAESLTNATVLMQSSAGEIQSVELAQTSQVSQVSQVSVVAEPAELLVSLPAGNATAGICLVVSGLLADFCKSYPGDISCNFQ